jgi:hypothetical protein
VAEYVGKIFEEVKQRPHFVVTKLLNFDSAETAAGPSASKDAAVPSIQENRGTSAPSRK